MAFSVDVKINKRFKVASPYDTVFKLLADVPASASHFPKVDRLVDLGNNAYRWEMEKIGLDRFHIQTIYASTYTSNKKEGWIAWTPIEGEGNAMVEGKWTLKKISPKSTQCALTTSGTLAVPLPGITKLVLAGLIEGEFKELVDTYIANLKAALTA